MLDESDDMSRVKSDFNSDKNYIRKQLKWSKEDDAKLISLVENFDGPKVIWSDIAKKFENKTKTQCYSRYRQINPNLKKGTWSKQEEDLLVELVGKFGKNWAKIASIHQTRSGKQIRDHYNYCIDNKTNFTEEEDMKILGLYQEYGNQFSKFAQFMPGRTGESIKNRFHSSIKRKYQTLKPKLFQSMLDVIGYDGASSIAKNDQANGHGIDDASSAFNINSNRTSVVASVADVRSKAEYGHPDHNEEVLQPVKPPLSKAFVKAIGKPSKSSKPITTLSKPLQKRNSSKFYVSPSDKILLQKNESGCEDGNYPSLNFVDETEFAHEFDERVRLRRYDRGMRSNSEDITSKIIDFPKDEEEKEEKTEYEVPSTFDFFKKPERSEDKLFDQIFDEDTRKLLYSYNPEFNFTAHHDSADFNEESLELSGNFSNYSYQDFVDDSYFSV